MMNNILKKEDFPLLKKLPDRPTNILKWVKFGAVFWQLILFVVWLFDRYNAAFFYGSYIIIALCVVRIILRAIRKKVYIFDIVEAMLHLIIVLLPCIFGDMNLIASTIYLFAFGSWIILMTVEIFVGKVKYNKKLPYYDSFIFSTKDISKGQARSVVLDISSYAMKNNIESAAQLLGIEPELTNDEYLKLIEENDLEGIEDEVGKEMEDSRVQITDSQFKALSISFFLHLLLWNFLTVISLGIAKPFVVAMREKYFAKRTWTDGYRNKFDGNGFELIGKYIIWLILSVVTLGIYLIVLESRLIKWKTKHTHFREVENKQSYYDGSAFPRFFLKLGLNILAVVTLGLMYPFKIASLNRYDKAHSVVDGYRLRFTGTAMGYFSNHILWTLLSIITIGIYYIFVPLKKEKWIRKNTHISRDMNENNKVNNITEGIETIPEKS